MNVRFKSLIGQSLRRQSPGVVNKKMRVDHLANLQREVQEAGRHNKVVDV